ncbi:MAG: type II toxin-antitoxin system PemK/MazF family toxin [Isosphaeraceae bacterium]
MTRTTAPFKDTAAQVRCTSVKPSRGEASVPVQNDRDHGRLTNTIVVLITRNVGRGGEPSQMLIDLTTPEGRQSGLNQTSAVVCTNLFTVAQTKARRIIGSLPPSLIAQVDDCLRVALGLP